VNESARPISVEQLFRRIAVSDRKVFGKGKLWQRSLELLAATDSDRAKGWQTANAKLPEGKYLIKVYVDAAGRLAADWKFPLGQADFAGQAEVQSSWPEGYNGMTEMDVGPEQSSNHHDIGLVLSIVWAHYCVAIVSRPFCNTFSHPYAEATPA
jgi:hypothetical protein